MHAIISEREIFEAALMSLNKQAEEIQLTIKEVKQLLKKPVKPFKPAKNHATKTKKKPAKSINEAASRALTLVRKQKPAKRKRNISEAGREQMRQNGKRLQALLRERREAIIAQAS